MELETLGITQPSGFQSSKYIGISSPSERLHFVPSVFTEVSGVGAGREYKVKVKVSAGQERAAVRKKIYN